MNRRGFITLGGAAAAMVAAPTALVRALAQEHKQPPRGDSAPPARQSLFPYFGRYTTEAMGKSLIPLVPKYENSYVGALAYRMTLVNTSFVQFGWEAGGAWRYGNQGRGAEVWGNVWITLGGFPVAGAALFTPGFAVGVSGVTNSIGKELDREQSIKGASAKVLGYLAPDFALAPSAWPGANAVYRQHHRSGGGGKIGRMHEGHNAQCGGLRVGW